MKMAAIPVRNPTIPFVGFIPGGLCHGRMIRVQGVMKPYADRFNINLQCGPSIEPYDDIALHVDVRPSEDAVVRNHYGEDGWGMEERYGGCPIQPGQSYEILILAQHTGYKIAINGTHFCEFAHRIPLTQVQFISVSNDTDVHFVGLEEDSPAQGSITVTATAPAYVTASAIPPPVNYGPSYAAPPPYMPPAGGVINAPIHPYNPNMALSYGGIPPSSYTNIPGSPYGRPM